ncbi:DUF4823 domain-containing protein [Myxococcus faecalis]|uniref:DUF4823 domain-containing protein n=1 Tax=Myxococcus faecalis TaxID=3115646 RepID=UPI003CECF0E2
MKATRWTVLSFLFLSACVTKTEITRLRAGPPQLTAAESLYVFIPADGVYENKRFAGSALATSKAVFVAFYKRTPHVKLGNLTERFEEGMKAARAAQSKYLVRPTLLHWEDRATQWSGKPDQIDVKLELIDVATGKVVNSTRLKATSESMSHLSSRPEDLLPKPLEQFVSSLY